MSLHKVFVTTICFLACPSLLHAQGPWSALELPPSIETTQEIVRTPPEWTASFDSLPRRVSGITIYDGPPEKMASLAPDREQNLGPSGKLVIAWTQLPSSIRGIWVSISYSGTSVLLNKQLPAYTSEVRVIYDEQVRVDGNSEIVSVEYR